MSDEARELTPEARARHPIAGGVPLPIAGSVW